MGGSRSAPLLTLLYALTFARWSRQPVPAARRFRRASFDRGRSRLLSRGYRWFESISLHRRVSCEPDLLRPKSTAIMPPGSARTSNSSRLGSPLWPRSVLRGLRFDDLFECPLKRFSASRAFIGFDFARHVDEALRTARDRRAAVWACVASASSCHNGNRGIRTQIRNYAGDAPD